VYEACTEWKQQFIPFSFIKRIYLKMMDDFNKIKSYLGSGSEAAFRQGSNV